jgi:cytoskeletal protein CcmA (bactofilin family)
MFSKSNSDMSRANEKSSGSVNAIGQGSTIKGDIITEGDLRIDGSLIGTINTKGRLVLGETGIVEGEVVCQNALIAGAVKARIQVSELLSLKATANLQGDIITNKLSIEPGANFTGSCSMGASIKNINLNENNDKSQEKTARSVS